MKWISGKRAAAIFVAGNLILCIGAAIEYSVLSWRKIFSVDFAMVAGWPVSFLIFSSAWWLIAVEVTRTENSATTVANASFAIGLQKFCHCVVGWTRLGVTVGRIKEPSLADL